MINYYKELELDMNLNREELEQEMKSIQKKWIHRQTSANQKKRHEAESKVQIISEAKTILLDDEKKKQYDTKLKKNNEATSLDYSTSSNNAFSQQLTLEEFEQQKENIRQLIDLKEYPKAISQSQYLTSVAPNHFMSWYLFALSNHSFGNYEMSIGYYYKSLELEPTYEATYIQLGYVYKMLRNSEKAYSYYKKAIQINPNSVDCTREMAILLRDNNQTEESVKYFEKLLEMEDTTKNKEFLADAYYKHGLSVLPYDNETFFFYEEEKISYYIEMITKAKEYSSNSFYDDEIKNATKALSKTYDWSKITLLTLPLIVFGETPLLLILSIIAIIYYSIRPKWVITRRKNHGTGTQFDTIANLYTKTVGYVIVITFGFILAFIGIAVRSNDWT